LPYELPPETIEILRREDLAETALGRHVLAYLAMLAESDEDAGLRFIEEHLAPGVLERYSKEDLLGELLKDQAQIGATDVAQIARTGTYALELTVQSQATGEWWLLRLQGQPEEPHRLVGIGVMDTMPPVEAQAEAAPAAAPAGNQGGGKWQFPDSPTGRALKALLTAIDSGDDAQIRAFVEAHFDEPFLKNFSMEEHLAVFRGLHESLPGLDVEQVEKTNPNAVNFILVSRETGNRVKGDFEVQPQPPHRIIGLGFEPAEDTSNDSGNDNGFGSLEEMDRDLNRRAAAQTFSGVVLIAREATPVLSNF
jgi:hypothetical protein